MEGIFLQLIYRDDFTPHIPLAVSLLYNKDKKPAMCKKPFEE